MAPVSSMTLTATSSVMSPSMSGPAKPAPGVFGPNPSDVMAPYAAALRRLLRALHRIIRASRLTLPAYRQRTKCIDATEFLYAVDIETHSRGNEGREHGTDVFAHDEVGDVVELGRISVDNCKPRAIALRHEGESGRRPHDQGRSDRHEQIAG